MTNIYQGYHLTLETIVFDPSKLIWYYSFNRAILLDVCFNPQYSRTKQICTWTLIQMRSLYTKFHLFCRIQGVYNVHLPLARSAIMDLWWFVGFFSASQTSITSCRSCLTSQRSWAPALTSRSKKRNNGSLMLSTVLFMLLRDCKDSVNEICFQSFVIQIQVYKIHDL